MSARQVGWKASLTKAIVLLGTNLAAAMLWAAPVHLRCNAMERPLGIDTPRPRLSWQSDSTEKDWKQTAYRVLVASRPELAMTGKADVWDSGKQMSDASVDVPFGGPMVESRRRYFWAVQVWDNKGHETSSAKPEWWEMGLLQRSDWTAQWITGALPMTKDVRWVWLAGADARHAMPEKEAEFRYRFDLAGKPSSATLSAGARGRLVVSVNGVETARKNDWHALDMEDIAPQLHSGSNEIAISVTTPPAASDRGGGPPPDGVVAGLAAVLTLEMPDGTVRRVAAGHGWEGREAKSGTWAAVKDVAALGDPTMGQSFGMPQPAALLRDRFQVAKPVSRARLYVTAAGSYQMFLNGKKVGNDYLTPDFTDYSKRIVYQTYDVTAMLASGGNSLGALLGGGWYGSPFTWAGTSVFTPPVRLLAQLELELSDGTRQIVTTSPEWKTAGSAVLSSELYAGELYDARLEQKGWDTAAFDDSRWSAAIAAVAPEAVLSAQVGMPVRRSQTITPKSVQFLANGDALFDMGQNMVGWVALHVNGPAGTTVKMRFAERLKPDGSIYTENLRNADATDTYILRGGGVETFTPHFTFHGFKYVQVTGLPSKATAATLTGEVLNSLSEEPSGRLKTSSDLLNRMWELGIWGQRGNFLSIPTDCPQRDERLGWMGDAGVFWRTGAYNFDIDAFSHKFTRDIVEGQTPAGAFSNVSPDLLRWAVGAPGWGDAGVIVPYTAWLQYGDRSFIDENWEAMTRWMDFIARSNPNFLREKELGPNYGDWLAPDQGTPKELAGTAYWAIVARMMAEMARATGRDARPYSELIDHIGAAYRKAYMAADGAVRGDTQSGYLLTLYAGLAPEELRTSMASRLVANIAAHQDHLTTGFLGTPFLLSVLSETGHTDVAYRLLFQETYPSWGYMVAKGATTWWERWNGDTGDPAMNSYNHYSFGSVVAWIYRDVVGIDTDPRQPGFKHLLIHPHFTDRLSFANGEYDSVYGKVSSSWKRTASGTHVSVTVPPNTTATVYLDQAPNGQEDQGTKQPHVAEVGSGTYQFDVPVAR